MTGWLRLGRGIDRLGGVFLALSAILLLLMLVLLGTEIVGRAAFGRSTQIADEYAGYLFTWMTICCFLHAQRNDRFLRVETVRVRLAPRSRALADGVAALLAALLTAILAYATWTTFVASVSFASVSIQPSQTPLAVPQAVMPFGLGLLTLAFVHGGITSLLQAAGRLPIAEPAITVATTLPAE